METRDGFIPLDDLVWPVTYRYQLQTLYGRANLELTVEAPLLWDDATATGKMAIPLFQAAIAPAMSFLTTLFDQSVYCWKLGRAVDSARRFPTGQQPHLPLHFDKGIAVVMHTNHEDRKARRRLIYPACPRPWVDGAGRLTSDGAGKMRSYLAGVFGGLSMQETGALFQWLTYYPETIPDPVTGFARVGFRRVHHLRLCEYTVPVPTASLL